MTALAERGTEITAQTERLEAELAHAEAESLVHLQAIAGDIALGVITQTEGTKRRPHPDLDSDFEAFCDVMVPALGL